MHTLVEIQQVSKSFGTVPAVSEISFQIPEGSIYGLLGPNGAGKTTLIRMITTITRPDSGQILFQGEPLTEKNALNMGYMPEERGLYKKMTVWNQLLFFAELKGLKSAEAKEQAKYWMRRLDIEPWAGKKMEELSKGMAQKVQFLTTILHQPKLIILDEPFSGFDPVNAEMVKELILELNKNGSTILFSTHRMDNVEEMCSHLAIINKGKLALNGETGGLRRKKFALEYEAGFKSPVSFSGQDFTPVKETTSPDGRQMYTFRLNNEDEQPALLKACLNAGNLVHFTELLPTIHDIFVQTVKEQQ
ncbi:MAG: ATP-binding cassette domain-containing protein [Bacteroidetes bacterium]|nr:ATP-binding cassette domain-containing protein [Bacteroidota bacterium]